MLLAVSRMEKLQIVKSKSCRFDDALGICVTAESETFISEDTPFLKDRHTLTSDKRQKK